MEGTVVVLTRTALYLTQRPSPRHVTETLTRDTVPMSITHTVTAFTCIDEVKFTHSVSKVLYSEPLHTLLFICH